MKKDSKKENFIKILITGLIVIAVIIIFVCIINKFKTDGMQQNTNTKVYYRTYTNNGWSKWVKDGMTSGDKKTIIKGLQIKIKSKEKGNVVFSCYYDKEWSKYYYSDEKCESKGKNMTGVRINVSDKMYESQTIFYRTYNEKDGWLKWETQSKSAGTGIDSKAISAIEIKVVPRSAYYADFLRDYNKNNKQSSEF